MNQKSIRRIQKLLKAFLKEANPYHYNEKKITYFTQHVPNGERDDVIIGLLARFTVPHSAIEKLMLKAKKNYFFIAYSHKHRGFTMELFWHNRVLLEGYGNGK